MKAILQGAGRPVLERRHRHLHQGRDRVGRRRRRPRQRRGAGQRKPAARQGDRRGRQPRRHARWVASSSTWTAAASTPTRMDNSAGVDCSDHEVNIKILVDSLVTAGKVSAEERTDAADVDDRRGRRLVLDDNASQNDLMGTSRANAASLLPVHARLIKDFVDRARAEPRTGGAAVGEGDPPAHRGRAGPDLAGTRDPDGARQAGAQGRTAGQRPARPGGVRRPAAATTSRRSCATGSAAEIRIASAAPRDRHHDAGQRSRRHRGHHATPTASPRTSASARSTRCAAYVATDAIFGVGEVWRADPRRRRRRGLGRRDRPDDAGSAPAHRPCRTLAAQLPAAAAGRRRRDQPVRREGGRADAADVGVAAR